MLIYRDFTSCGQHSTITRGLAPPTQPSYEYYPHAPREPSRPWYNRYYYPNQVSSSAVLVVGGVEIKCCPQTGSDHNCSREKMRLYMLMCLLVLLMASSPHAHFSASGEASGEDDPTEQTPTTASPTSLPERLLVNCPFPLPWPFPPLNYLKMPMAVFYPCLPTPQHIDDIPECDVFAYLALQQTREAINIPNSTHFDVQYKPRLLTCFIITPIDIQTRVSWSLCLVMQTSAQPRPVPASVLTMFATYRKTRC